MELLALKCGSLARSCALALCGLLAVCLLSRMCAYGRSQVARTVRRLMSEAEAQADMSRQDADPFVALLHNAEATAHLRAAKGLSEESGLGQERDFVDALAELSEEQDDLIRALMRRLEQ